MTAPRYRMPAEWEPHEATWLAWPHNVSDWPGKFAPIPWVYGEIVRKIAPGERVRILVNSPTHERRARQVLSRAGVDLRQIDFFPVPTNRVWTRDYGPVFARPVEQSGGDGVPPPADARGTRSKRASRASGGRNQNPAVIKFHFNAWAKYDDWQLDDAVAEQAARAIGAPLVRAKSIGGSVVLEGGAIDVNGQGDLLTTEECLLDSAVQCRNPELDRSDIEQALCEWLGAEQVHWLGRGIAGDDTHGHVDDLCRFVAPNRVVLGEQPDPSDPDHRALEENRERLEEVRLASGTRLDIIRLPMPAPLSFARRRLPASYANFYIANAAVLVPTFNDPNDRLALGILAELFPDRPVVGVHCVDLVWGLGTIHCMTQQQPIASL